MEIGRIYITPHAAERFCERVRATDRPEEEMLNCLRAADHKMLRKAIRRGRRKVTTYVITGCCAFIIFRGKLVTVITKEQLRAKWREIGTYRPSGKCSGFTRPNCQPCPSLVDLEEVTYDSMGQEVTAILCAVCRSQLLRGPQAAWT